MSWGCTPAESQSGVQSPQSVKTLLEVTYEHILVSHCIREMEFSMSFLKLQVRWYSNATQHSTLELEVNRTAFMIVDSDCGSGNEYVEKGIAPALVAAREVGMKVVFIHNDFSLVDEPGSIKREIHGTRWGNPEAATKPPPPLPRCRIQSTDENNEQISFGSWSSFLVSQL